MTDVCAGANPPVNPKSDPLVEYRAGVKAAAGTAAARYRRWVSREDVEQELWTYLFDHDSDCHGLTPAKLGSRLRGAADRYCRKEKAARCGYDTVDEYFYSVDQLERIVWDAFDAEATPPREPYRDDEKYSEWVAEVSDVRRAIRRRVFPLRHYTALREYVTEGRARDVGVNDALWALRRQLGGGKPR